MKLLEGKKAIITGGNAGIGKAVARRFVEQGARVAIFARNKESGKQVVEELAQIGGADCSTFFKVDVSLTEPVEKAVSAALKLFGNVDILVNNAGITKDGLFMKMSEADWDSVINVNLKSVFNLCKALTRPMMKARSGKIINISSVIGLTGNAGQVNYASSKAGILGFTKSLAKELASRNICVNCVAPGFVKTDMTEVLQEQVKEGVLQQIPLKRIGKPSEIADAVLFLASSMSSYMTGQVLTVDGGMVM